MKSSLTRALARILGTLGDVCISCKLGSCCGGCGCCTSRP